MTGAASGCSLMAAASAVAAAFLMISTSCTTSSKSALHNGSGTVKPTSCHNLKSFSLALNKWLTNHEYKWIGIKKHLKTRHVFTRTSTKLDQTNTSQQISHFLHQHQTSPPTIVWQVERSVMSHDPLWTEGRWGPEALARLQIVMRLRGTPRSLKGPKSRLVMLWHNHNPRLSPCRAQPYWEMQVAAKKIETGINETEKKERDLKL